MSWAILLALAIVGNDNHAVEAVGKESGPVSIRIDDINLPDLQGKLHCLNDWHETRLVVVVFLGVDCPLAKLYTHRLNELSKKHPNKEVRFVGVFSNRHDGVSEIREFVEQHSIAFLTLQDTNNVVADRFQAERITHAFVLDAKRQIRYSGRIDDKYSVGVQRHESNSDDLANAIDQLLSEDTVAVPVTKPIGCLISRVKPMATTAAAKITYMRDIAPIFDQHCVSCHRPGQAAPFALTDYEAASDWADTILEVIDDGRMPPWHADSRYGRFSNDISLSELQKNLIRRWVATGAPAGDLSKRPSPPTFHAGWKIGTPDLVIPMPQPFIVPAEGIIEYQFIEVDPGFEKETWITAAEVQSTNPAVVHHCNVFLKPPGSDSIATRGALGSFCLVASAVGTPPTMYPAGMAKLVPKGWKLVFVMHYVAIGSEQTDTTRLGLKIVDASEVQKEVATRILLDEDLNIPPNAANHIVKHEWTTHENLLLLSMFPHMHLRGKSFRYEAVYPSGQTEILLDVPRYDFNWQNQYVLSEPKHLPQGTTIRCIGIYDNSASNPFNPDPSVTVRTGPQVEDEMFNGYFDVVLADEDRTAGASRWQGWIGTENSIQMLIIPAIALALLMLFGFRRNARVHA